MSCTSLRDQALLLKWHMGYELTRGNAHEGSANSSDEESQGSDNEEEAHHRTVRGREAQQIVQRLKNSYLHRSMSAPDAALSPGASTLMPICSL